MRDTFHQGPVKAAQLDVANPALLADIERIAEAYPDTARFVGAAERDRHLTAAQRLAWALRFGTDDLIAGEARALRIEGLEAPADTQSANPAAAFRDFSHRSAIAANGPTKTPTTGQF